MGKKKASVETPKKKHHRVKKMVTLAVAAGAAYGIKKYLDSKKGFSSKKI